MKKVTAVFIVLLLTLSQVELTQDSFPIRSFPISVERAIEVATEELANGDWPKAASIVSCKPIYLDGIDGVSYWECKASANGQDAGFVLVNANKTDLLIPEAAPRGGTLFEDYEKEIGAKDFKIVRYDWFRSVALSNSGQILASRGMGESKQEIAKAIDDYRKNLKEQKVKSVHLGGDLTEYYTQLAQEKEVTRLGFLDNALAKRKIRHLRVKLKHKFHKDHYTPRWKQFDKPNGAAIGCGPVAWAILYSYWHRFKAKTKLFKGKNINTKITARNSTKSPIKEVITELYSVCGTTEKPYKGKIQGFTPPKRMQRGINYAKRCGYKNSTAGRTRGSEFSKFSKVAAHLNADKPVILLIKSDGLGIPNHYVVIEEACKNQEKRRRKWRDKAVKYFVNYCWGKPSKWIYVREVGRNKHKVHTAGSVYLVNVR